MAAIGPTGSNVVITGFPETRKQKAPLYETRPRSVKDAIEANFKAAQTPVHYKYCGSPQYEFDLMGSKVSSDEILKKILLPGMKIFDIGTGNGEFLKHAEEQFNVQASGCSARDFRFQNREIPNDKYHILNIEDFPPNALEKYDCLVGLRAFNHFVDPLGTLELLYNNHLELKGYILIRDMNILCGEDVHPVQFMEELVEHLNRSGRCRVAAGIQKREDPSMGILLGHCDFLFIQKLTDQPMELPLKFLDRPIADPFDVNPSKFTVEKPYAGYEMRLRQIWASKDQAIIGCDKDNPLDFFQAHS